MRKCEERSCGRIDKKEHKDLHDEVSFWIRKRIAQKHKIFPEWTNKKDCLKGSVKRKRWDFILDWVSERWSELLFNPETRYCDDNRKDWVDSGWCNSLEMKQWKQHVQENWSILKNSNKGTKEQREWKVVQ